MLGKNGMELRVDLSVVASDRLRHLVHLDPHALVQALVMLHTQKGGVLLLKLVLHIISHFDHAVVLLATVEIVVLTINGVAAHHDVDVRVAVFQVRNNVVVEIDFRAA